MSSFSPPISFKPKQSRKLSFGGFKKVKHKCKTLIKAVPQVRPISVAETWLKKSLSNSFEITFSQIFYVERLIKFTIAVQLMKNNIIKKRKYGWTRMIYAVS